MGLMVNRPSAAQIEAQQQLAEMGCGVVDPKDAEQMLIDLQAQGTAEAEAKEAEKAAADDESEPPKPKGTRKKKT